MTCILLFFSVVKYYIEVHTSEAEMTAGTNANVFITLYGSQSDSGRRHLIHSREARKRFQPGQVKLLLLCPCLFAIIHHKIYQYCICKKIL